MVHRQSEMSDLRKARFGRPQGGDYSLMWSHGCERFSLGQSPTFPSNYNPVLDLQSYMLGYNLLHAAVISIPLRINVHQKLACRFWLCLQFCIIKFKNGFFFLFLFHRLFF